MEMITYLVDHEAHQDLVKRVGLGTVGPDQTVQPLTNLGSQANREIRNIVSNRKHPPIRLEDRALEV